MHRFVRSLVSGLAGALAFIPVAAHASLLGATGNFSESLDTPYYKNTGPLVLQANGQTIDGSTQLTSANTTSNPSNYRGVLQAALGATSLTLTPDVFNDYQTITFTVSAIAGAPSIVGFRLVSDGAIDTSQSMPFTRSVSFTANSLTVTYTSNNPSGGDEFYLNPNGLDTFAITTADQVGTPAVPEPASLAILAVGLTSAGVVGRRRRA